MKAQLHDPNEQTLSENNPRPKQDFSKLKAGEKMLLSLQE